MKSGLYAGSFDPITLGHVDVVSRASQIFDKVYVVISENSRKHPLFTVDERLKMATDALIRYSNVEVIVSNHLTIDLADKLGTKVLIRGVRGSVDVEKRMSIADLNEKLNDSIQTILIPTTAVYRSLSSSMVKEVAEFHGNVFDFVPKNVANELLRKFS